MIVFNFALIDSNIRIVKKMREFSNDFEHPHQKIVILHEKFKE